jgi:putrescine aminotransferase
MNNNNRKPSKFWHPFANMALVERQEVVLSRGEGVWLWDEHGQRYLDATAGLWYCFLGHGRAELADAAARQMKKLAAYSTFGDLANEPALELAERVAEISPIEDSVVFFTSGGSESIDTAAKMVRRYWTATGQPQRQLLITRRGSYHGVAGYGTSLAGIEANAAGYGELIPGIVCIPPDSPEALAKAIEEHPGQVAAFFGEPVRGAGGVYPPVPGYWTEIERICRKNDVLLVVDEVITGFGRLGTWFGSSRFEMIPDIITGAKGITSGYSPLGVVICGPRVQEPFWKGTGEMFRHGYTYSGHATACAVGIANLKLMEEEKILDHVAGVASVLQSGMQGLLSHPLVREIRCAGLLAAFELSAEARAVNPKVADIVVAEARRNGVISRALVGHSVQISPPLVITAEEVRFMTDAFLTTLSSVEKELFRRVGA